MIGLNLISLNLLKLDISMGKRKTNQLSLRLPPPLLDDLEKAVEVTGFDEQEIAKALIRTFVRQVNSGEKITFPFRLESEKSKAEPPQILPQIAGTGNTPFTDSIVKLHTRPAKEEQSERETRPVTESPKRVTKPKATH